MRMPFGKARERRRGRKADPETRDPESTEAYEHGWYALLARQSEGVGGDTAATAGAAPEEETPASEPNGSRTSSSRLATVTPLLAPGPLRHPSQLAARTADPPERADQPGDAREGSAVERPSIRIGVHRLADPDTVYLRYLTDSSHRDFFRGDWWPTSRSITPVHLWRANHLGAGWDMERVERFMLTASQRADELVAAAPRGDRPGSSERRAWMRRFLGSEWVQEFGIGRVSKSLSPLLPDLVPDLDLTMQPWAAEHWLGLEHPSAAEEPHLSLERWELIEDVLVLRGPQLEKVAGRLRRLAPGLAPIGRLGVVVAAFWEGYWADLAARAARRRPAASRTPRAASPSKAKSETKATASTARAPRTTKAQAAKTAASKPSAATKATAATKGARPRTPTGSKAAPTTSTAAAETIARRAQRSGSTSETPDEPTPPARARSSRKTPPATSRSA
jgi:hypothetical protein